jgi:predicted component of type VI protein secretion system
MPVLRLMTADGRSVEREIVLGFGPTTIGRADINTVIVDDVSISRRHATLEVTPQGYRLLDERSANGVFVRGRRVTDATVAAGETFRLGQRWLQIVDDSAAAAGVAPRSSGATWLWASCLLLLLAIAVCVGALLIYLSRERWTHP